MTIKMTSELQSKMQIILAPFTNAGEWEERHTNPLFTPAIYSKCSTEEWKFLYHTLMHYRWHTLHEHLRLRPLGNETEEKKEERRKEAWDASHMHYENAVIICPDS